MGSYSAGRRHLTSVAAAVVDHTLQAAELGARYSTSSASGSPPGCGAVVSTARTPNWTLSLDMSSVTSVTSPTGIARFQSGAVLSRHTTS